MNNIQIQVVGQAGAGKSVIARTIQRALEGHKISVVVDDIDDDLDTDAETDQKRLNTLAERSTLVSVGVVQARREQG